jgi:chromosome condensin MukBEF MukE localization factor
MDTALAHPELAEIFRRLRDGRHLCLEDGKWYEAIERDTDSFTALFKALGYELVSHRKGIYYFRGDSAVTETARKFAVFTFILVEHFGDAGRGIEEAVLTNTFALDDLPHLTSERYRQTMAEVGVQNVEDLAKLLGSMQRFGFAELAGEDRVRFRRPIYRLLDLCTRVLESEIGGEAP